jgi:hypothetical protein
LMQADESIFIPMYVEGNPSGITLYFTYNNYSSWKQVIIDPST